MLMDGKWFGAILPESDHVSHIRPLLLRYVISVDPRRHNDVLAHMNLVNRARQANADLSPSKINVLPAGPLVSVRQVYLGQGSANSSEATLAGEAASGVGYQAGLPMACQPGTRINQALPVPIRQGGMVRSNLPKPTFGSAGNLSFFGSPTGSRNSLIRNSGDLSCSKSPPIIGSSGRSGGGGGGQFSLLQLDKATPRHTPPLRYGQSRGSLCSMEEGMEDEDEGGRSAASSLNDGGEHLGMGLGGVEDSGSLSLNAPMFGWEVTVAAPDRPGLLSAFTRALSNSSLDLNIRVSDEAM